MKELLSNFKISIQDSIYNKDPESSDLGKRIIKNSIEMIAEIGFDDFTFKKLGKEIGSNESSIYRYFDNKHKLLVYLCSWYWSWVEYRLVIETYSIQSPIERLKKAIEITSRPTSKDLNYDHIDEVLLNKIIINDYAKSFLTQEVDKENQDGYFKVYQRLISRIKNMISDVNLAYEYPASLASTLVETALHQHFLKDHFPKMTDCKNKISPTQFLTDLFFRTLNISHNDK